MSGQVCVCNRRDAPSSPAQPASRAVKPKARHQQQVQLVGCLQGCGTAKHEGRKVQSERKCVVQPT